MTLNVVYVEDETRHWEFLKEAVAALNDRIPESSRVALTHARSPDELGGLLHVSVDVVLADVCYEDSAGKDVNRLDELIRTVTEWESHSRRGRPLPIIALTGKGKAYVEFCLKRRDSLYDIWDKGAASPEYRASRFSRLAAELSASAPGCTYPNACEPDACRCALAWARPRHGEALRFGIDGS